MMNIHNDSYKIMNTSNGIVIGKVIATCTSGVLIHKPQFVNYNEKEEMIYLTDVFEGLSISTEYYLSYSQILFSGLPDPQLITMYQTHIGEITEEEYEEEQQDNNNKTYH
jgi:hypothetical protein